MTWAREPGRNPGERTSIISIGSNCYRLSDRRNHAVNCNGPPSPGKDELLVVEILLNIPLAK
jgi:hypothetical protein